MKNLRKLQSIMLALALVLGLVTVSSSNAFAANSKVIPKAVHIYTQSVDDSAINLSLAEAGDKIKDIKTSSTNLIAKQTQYNTSSSSQEGTRVNIGLYAKKDGKYSLTFNIYNKTGEKKESATITVYANKDHAVKSVTFQDKKIEGLQTVESGKVKVTMNTGYKLVKLEYGVEKSSKDESGNINSDTVYKEFKSGDTIRLGTEAYKSSSSYSYDESDGSKYFNEYLYTSLFAYTHIRVTYIDKYTNEKTESTYSIYRVAVN